VGRVGAAGRPGYDAGEEREENVMVQGNLDGIRLLAPLAPTERAALAARCAWRRFRAGELVLSREADDRDVLFLAAGRLRVVNYAASGREIAYGLIEPGAHVGELAALDGEPRSASVEAVEPCLVASLASGPFHELLLSHPELAVAMLKNLARIIRRTDERIAELSVLSAMQRIYRELNRLARPGPEGGAVIAPLPTQEGLAAVVGTTRETVARALGHLARAGTTRRRGRELLILKPDLLEALAETDA
jgi:CRP/FNR family transcriptional regulator, cyclic AMP receptor protein